jgi:hypothetical protein
MATRDGTADATSSNRFGMEPSRIRRVSGDGPNDEPGAVDECVGKFIMVSGPNQHSCHNMTLKVHE